MGISIEKYTMIVEAMAETVSLDMPTGDDEKSSLIDHIADEKSLSIEEIAVSDLLKEELLSAMKNLSEREENILLCRLGLYDGKIWTLEEIGLKLGITRERVRQLETQAIRKLKNACDKQ